MLGARGQVGAPLLSALTPLGRVVGAARPVVDFRQPDSLLRLVRDVRPAIIVNAAADTAVDRAQTEPEPAFAVNATAVGVLAEAAKESGALLVHYSTDYVFPGTACRPYSEEDAIGPVNVYGQSKWAGEEVIRAYGAPHLILRTSWVYGPLGHNFLLTMLRLAQSQKEIRVVCDQIGAPTLSRDLAAITAQILLRFEKRPELTGTYHVTAAGETSWYGFAERIVARVAGRPGFLCKNITPIPTSAYPLPAPRPAYSVLSCAKLKRVFGLELPAWEKSLDTCLTDMGY